jgi:hypothetical protein
MTGPLVGTWRISFDAFYLFVKNGRHGNAKAGDLDLEFAAYEYPRLEQFVCATTIACLHNRALFPSWNIKCVEPAFSAFNAKHEPVAFGFWPLFVHYDSRRYRALIIIRRRAFCG